jgi:signal transduction protein with GAF and PtsI domain
MGKRISEARIMRKKAEKLKLKAKKEILRDYPKLMEDPEQRKKVFELIDNASVAVDSTGNIRIIYQNMENKDLINLS